MYGIGITGPAGPRGIPAGVEEMATQYIEEPAPRPTGRTRHIIRLGGYCFGGIVAYEMARQLTRPATRKSPSSVMS